MSGDAKGGAKRPYQQEDAFRSIHVIDGVLSPDGAFAVYQVSETVPGKTRDDDKQLTALWRVNLGGGEPRRLTPRGGNAGSPQFTQDGRALLFLSARGDVGVAGPVFSRGGSGRVTQIHRLPLDGGEAEEVTALEQGVASFALSPDGEWIAYAALEAVPEPRGPHEHLRINRQSYRLDAPGYLQDMAQAIYLIPSSGGEARRLTSHDGLVSAMAWSPDSREIAFVVVGGADRMTVFSGELSVVDREGHERKLVDDAVIAGLFWTTDGRRIGYSAPPGSFATQPQLFLIDKAGGEPESRTAAFDRAVKGAMHISGPALMVKSRLLPTADGAGVIAPVNVGGETSLFEIALAGEERLKPLNAGPHNCNSFDLVSSSLLFSHQDCNTPSELWVLDLKTGAARALTRHNAEWQAEIAWPELERVTVGSAPGVEIEGWVLKPSTGAAPFKTILYIHGGPHVAHGYTFSEDFQELVGAGYALAFANPRGSTGYGDEFAGAIIGCWGHPETADFNAFLDELVRRGVADPDRLGVTGVSGGGHLSGWLIGQTDRFKAAIPEQGVYNMFSMYGVSDVGIDLIGLEMGGPPHEQVQRYWDLSPIAYAHKVRTPTLLIQGENDIRCPMEQAEQFYAVLKHNGCEVEFLRLKNCNHALEWYGPPPLRRVRMDALKDWFARHIP